jgi:hypothetical protein
MTNPASLIQLSELCGQSRAAALQQLQRQVKGTLQVIAGLDHLDDSRRDWLPQLQVSLRYDLNDCVQQVMLNTRVVQPERYHATSGIKPQVLLADWRARGLPFLNLGGVLHNIAEGVSFCFEGQQLVQVVLAAPRTS